MKAQSTHFHSINSGREECVGVFRVGKYKIKRELQLYKDGNMWRLIKNDKEVEINDNNSLRS